jgi:hypothetical protein
VGKKPKGPYNCANAMGLCPFLDIVRMWQLNDYQTQSGGQKEPGLRKIVPEDRLQNNF